jgi:hypothetical protein
MKLAPGVRLIVLVRAYAVAVPRHEQTLPYQILLSRERYFCECRCTVRHRTNGAAGSSAYRLE